MGGIVKMLPEHGKSVDLKHRLPLDGLRTRLSSANQAGSWLEPASS